MGISTPSKTPARCRVQPAILVCVVVSAAAALDWEVASQGAPCSPMSWELVPLDVVDVGITQLSDVLADAEPGLEPEDPPSTQGAPAALAPTSRRGVVQTDSQHSTEVTEDVLLNAPKQSPPV